MPKPTGSRPSRDAPAARDRRSKPQAIFLLGFMGAGKSSVGRCLAEQLHWSFEDLDERIEKREDSRIHEIFQGRGEAGFRVAERAALQELLSDLRAGTHKVVALGGGAFVQKESARLIQGTGIATVFLDASVDELWRRCRKQADRDGVERPLLRSLAKFRDLYKQRRPHYAKALFYQSTDGKTVDEIALELAGMTGASSGRPSSSKSVRMGARRKALKRRERGGKN